MSVTFGNAPDFGKVEFGPAPDMGQMSMNWGPAPEIQVNWSGAPTLSCVVTVECSPAQSPGFRKNALDDNFTDDFNTEDFDIEINDLGIPSEIKIAVPKFPDIQVKHDIPNFIDIKSDIPSRIVLYQADVLPREIRIVNESVIPEIIRLDSKDIPNAISLDASGIPGSISLVPVDIPSVIRLDGSEIPDTIRVVGIPDSIEVKMPSEIVARLELPENLEVPLVYKGGPIPIQFDNSNLAGEDQACFALVPCNKK
jgi:hypothetical protein